MGIPRHQPDIVDAAPGVERPGGLPPAVGELAADDDCYYLVLPQDGNYTGSLEAHGYAVLCAVEGTPPGTGTDYGKTYLLYRLEEGAADADVH